VMVCVHHTIVTVMCSLVYGSCRLSRSLRSHVFVLRLRATQFLFNGAGSKTVVKTALTTSDWTSLPLAPARNRAVRGQSAACIRGSVVSGHLRHI